jgi:membrane fusion protein (multidrug efflux system)
MDKWQEIKKQIQKYRQRLLVGGPVLFLALVWIVYMLNGRYVSTDDAYVQAARTEISSNVPGRVLEIAVRDNQEVRQCDILFKLDDRDYQVAVKEAQARLASTKLEIASLKATYKQNQANVKSAAASLSYLKKEFDRQVALAAAGISSQSQLQQAQQAYIAAKEKVNAAQEELQSTKASLDNKPEINVNEHPLVQHAQAALEQANLNLSYTIIQAPLAGIVSKVEQLQVGDYINAATPVFGLIANKDSWVEGNFKETELTNIRPGQKATIKIDTYPQRVFHGKVVSISPGTGSSFSLLPPENATGNWVKVVQRLPVRISIEDSDANLPLRMGLSAIVEVDTQSKPINKGE